MENPKIWLFTKDLTYQLTHVSAPPRNSYILFLQAKITNGDSAQRLI